MNDEQKPANEEVESRGHMKTPGGWRRVRACTPKGIPPPPPRLPFDGFHSIYRDVVPAG